MRCIDSNADWRMVKLVLDFFKQETTCLDKQGTLTIKPEYVVAIDDDPVSAYYAAIIMKKAQKQFGYYPTMLCCGGIGMLSKYINEQANGEVISEGEKLAQVARSLDPNFPLKVLDHGRNTGANLKEIIDFLASQHNSDAPIIFCPTARLSKRLERTIAFSTEQFPGTKPLNAYYYVPGESVADILQLYNGKGLAAGLPLLSEVAAVYDRVGTERYVGKFMAPLDKPVPPEVQAAGRYLVEKYPIRVSRLPIRALGQFLKMYFALAICGNLIDQDLQAHVRSWRREL